MLFKKSLLVLFTLSALSASAQNDTYIQRHMDYGKKVGPAVPVRKLYIPKSLAKPGLKTRINIKYPKLAVRLMMEGTVWVTFDVGPDGLVKTAEFERMDSLVIWEKDQKKLATYAEAGKQSMIEEAKRAITALRLAPADSVRHFRVPFRFKLL